MAYRAHGKTRFEWAASMVGKMTIHGRLVTGYEIGIRATGCWFYTSAYAAKHAFRSCDAAWHPWPKDCKEDCE